MTMIHIPYGRTELSAEVPDENLLGIYHSEIPAEAADPAAEVERALDFPIGSQKLEELAEGKWNAVIIASDHTRPVPSRILMPSLLARLRKGNPEIKITILIATGCHRETSKHELIEKFGEEIVENETIVVHDSSDSGQLVEVGTLPSGGKLVLNKLAMEADLLISEGFIEPHFFAGFSGGRKSVLPGIAARETVLANHCSEFIQSPYAKTGNLAGNPIHEDMIFAAEKANLAFILNVVINDKKKIVRAFAGDREKAHEAGCEFLRSVCGISVPQADIVITGNGGYPLDQNVYQCVKGMTAGEAVCRPGGVIILAASGSDGHGGEEFYRVLSECSSAQDLLDSLAAIPRDKTTPDQWQYQILARILAQYKLIFVTKDCDHQMIRDMKMETAGSLEEAIDKALVLCGKESKIAVIPDGVSVIAELKQEKSIMNDSFGMLWAKSVEDLKGQWGNAIIANLLVSLILGGAGIFSALIQIFICHLNFGLSLFYLRLIRSEYTTFEFVFLPFNQYGRFLWGCLRPAIFVFLWGLLFVIPGIIACYRYILTPYLMLDHPEFSAKDAMEQSKRMMKGHKFQLFCYYILFAFLFLFTAILTLGIGLLWLGPFMKTFEANYYQALKNELEPSTTLPRTETI